MRATPVSVVPLLRLLPAPVKGTVVVLGVDEGVTTATEDGTMEFEVTMLRVELL